MSIFFTDIVLDTLKSKASLATDSSGKIIEGSGGGGLWEQGIYAADIIDPFTNRVVIDPLNGYVDDGVSALQVNGAVNFNDPSLTYGGINITSSGTNVQIGSGAIASGDASSALGYSASAIYSNSTVIGSDQSGSGNLNDNNAQGGVTLGGYNPTTNNGENWLMILPGTAANTPRVLIGASTVDDTTSALQVAGVGAFGDLTGLTHYATLGVADGTGSVFGHGTAGDGFLGSSTEAGYFISSDLERFVYISDSTYAINATGESYFTNGSGDSVDFFNAGTGYVINAVGGQSEFVQGTNYADLAGSAFAGYFYDGTHGVSLADTYWGAAIYATGGTDIFSACDGTYAINATGMVNVSDSSQFPYPNSAGYFFEELSASFSDDLSSSGSVTGLTNTVAAQAKDVTHTGSFTGNAPFIGIINAASVAGGDFDTSSTGDLQITVAGEQCYAYAFPDSVSNLAVMKAYGGAYYAYGSDQVAEAIGIYAEASGALNNYALKAVGNVDIQGDPSAILPALNVYAPMPPLYGFQVGMIFSFEGQMYGDAIRIINRTAEAANKQPFGFYQYDTGEGLMYQGDGIYYETGFFIDGSTYSIYATTLGAQDIYFGVNCVPSGNYPLEVSGISHFSDGATTTIDMFAGINAQFEVNSPDAPAGYFYDGTNHVHVGSGTYALETTGHINVSGLPTSSANLSAGDLWIDTTGGLNILKVK